MIYRTIHSDELCEGGSSGPRGCPRADDVECSKCGYERTVEDGNCPGLCPVCRSTQAILKRCKRCPVEDLSYIRAHCNAGRLFERLLELEFATKHCGVAWTDVTAEEIRGLQILNEERERFHRDQARDVPGV